MKYEAMSKLTDVFPVVEMCKVLGVSRESYYRWVKQDEKREEKRIAEISLINRIEKMAFILKLAGNISRHEMVKWTVDIIRIGLSKTLRPISLTK